MAREKWSIVEVDLNYGTLTTDDGRTWLIDPGDILTVTAWKAGDTLVADLVGGLFPYKLKNGQESVFARESAAKG